MNRVLHCKLKGREFEEDPTTYGRSVPFEVAAGYTASR